MKAVAARAQAWRIWSLKSSRCAQAPVKYPGTSETVFVTLAVTGGTPSATSVEKETRVPPPANALMAPAAPPAPAAAR